MVFVLSDTNKKLMPTSSYRARKLLKAGKATIYKYHPFTIKLTQRSDGDTQPIEYCCDTGYQHVGISIKSEKNEFVNEQGDLLADETERHNDCRKYRRNRRNRKTRHRKARWQNRKGKAMCKDGFAPSIRNRRDVHIQLFRMYEAVCPITSGTFEMGQFDTQVLKAQAEGRPLPEGTDYQHGETYGYATLREAVFARDGYKCICCGKSALKDGAILRMHHLGYLAGDRSNRMDNLAAVCTKCHTSKNHKKGGKLYGLSPKLRSFKGATFMTAVRYDMFARLRASAPDVEFRMAYGAMTKLKRKELNVKKTHSNDAYCMGEFHPKHRTDFMHYKKRRRNNRILSRFYDAKYVDIRDGRVRSGQQLSCGRTSRSESRHSGKNERVYRGQKVSKGRVSARRQHYQYRPGDRIWVNGIRYIVKGTQDRGTRVAVQGHLPLSAKKIEKCVHIGGWVLVS